MTTSLTILVIILSVTLFVLLVLLIVTAALTIKLLHSVKRITDRAEHIVADVGHVGDAFRDAAGPLALLRLVSNIARIVSKHNKGKKR